MKLAEIMREHDIELGWLFTLSKLKDKEGLMFFEPIIEDIKDEDGKKTGEVSNLNPKCFYIDGGKFVYDEELDGEIIINAVDDVITFTRIDGIQLNINLKDIDGFPFSHAHFSELPFKSPDKGVPKDHVEVE